MNAFTNTMLISRALLIRWVFILGCLLVSGSVQADLRVLIKFDHAEHRVHRLVEVKSANPAFDLLKPSPENALSDPTKVSVQWLGVDGSTLFSASMNDPRLTHVPLANADASPTLIGLNEGAYMVSGPSDSAILRIRLPANTALALDAQIWQFELNH